MTAALPTISIVTPSFNHGLYVERTVRSVLMQRYPALEYVLMDGGSTDDTVERLRPYRDRFHHWRSEPDGGQSQALADGFAQTTGQIMAYLNSDDMLAPGALHWVAAFFAAHPEVDMVYSHRLTVDERDRAWWYWILPEHSSWLMRRWDLIPQETAFWRRRLWDREGGIDPSYRFAMDYDLFVRFMRSGRLHRADRFLGAFRWHEAAKTSTQMETIGKPEIARVWRENGLIAPTGHKLLSERLTKGAEWRGVRHARSGRIKPGALPGTGWSYDALWGGLLTARPS